MRGSSLAGLAHSAPRIDATSAAEASSIRRAVCTKKATAEKTSQALSHAERGAGQVQNFFLGQVHSEVFVREGCVEKLNNELG